MGKIIGIYKLTNLVNGKIYIGKSVDIKRRLSRHKHSERAKKTDSHLDKAIKKYGWCNFKSEIIHQQDNSNNLLEVEAGFIQSYKSTDPNIGYNLCEYSSDFTGKKHSEETRKKLSEINKGKHIGDKNWMFGKTHSLEVRKKISDANQNNFGKNNPFYGKKHKKESMLKMVETKRRTKGYKKRKPVIQLDLKGEYIAEWPSAEDAAINLFSDAGKKNGICACCQGRPKHATSMGFKWKYKIDYEKLLDKL